MSDDKIKINDVINFLGSYDPLYKEETAAIFSTGYIYGLLASNNGHLPEQDRLIYMHIETENYLKRS